MDDRELLKILNSIEYKEEELIELEHKAIEIKNTIGEDLYKVKNDKVLRKIAFMELEQKVKSQLHEGEEIKYKMIVLQSYMEKEIYAVYSGPWGAQVATYIGLWITNNRIFIYKLNHFYTILEEYKNDIVNIMSFTDLWEKCDTIGLKFNDNREILPRPFGKESKDNFLEIIKYLKEKTNAQFKGYKEEKLPKIFWVLVIIAIVGFMGIAWDMIMSMLDVINTINK